MNRSRLLISLLCLVFLCAFTLSAYAEESSDDTYSCIISNASDESITISDPAIITRLARDIFNTVDFDTVEWMDNDMENLTPSTDYVYRIDLVKNPDSASPTHVLILVGENALSVNNVSYQTDSITCYLVDGLFNGLNTEPSAQPLQ